MKTPISICCLLFLYAYTINTLAACPSSSMKENWQNLVAQLNITTACPNHYTPINNGLNEQYTSLALCGNMLLTEVFSKWNCLSATQQKSVLSETRRPVDGLLERTAQSRHFMIHYSLTPVYRPVSPYASVQEVNEWITALEMYLEEAYTLLVEEMGFLAPPPDGNKGGGLNLYDVYVKNLDSGAWGLTNADGPLSENSAKAVTYMILANTTPKQIIQHANLLEATAIHEFFHMIQNAYYGSRLADVSKGLIPTAKSISLIEGTAVWAESLFSKQSNLNNQIGNTRYYEYLYFTPNIFSQPYRNIFTYKEKAMPLYAYSSVFFWKFLSDQYGEDIIKKIWTLNSQQPHHQTAIQTELSILETVLAEYGGLSLAVEHFLVGIALIYQDAPYHLYQQNYPEFTFTKGAEYKEYLSEQHLVKVLKCSPNNKENATGILFQATAKEAKFHYLNPVMGCAFYQLKKNDAPNGFAYTIKIQVDSNNKQVLQPSDLQALLLKENTTTGELIVQKLPIDSVEKNIVFSETDDTSHQLTLILYRLTDPELARKLGTTSLRYELFWEMD